MRIFRWIPLILVIFLSGCSTTAPLFSEDHERWSLKDRWAFQEANNRTISEWHLRGKLSIKAGTKGGSSTLRWSYADTAQNIQLYGPLGGGRVIVDVEPGQAILKDSKGQIIEGLSAEEVLYERLGWHVPFDELAWWSRGLPDIDSTEIEIDNDGLLKRLEHGIWEVEYLEYSRVDSYVLPRRLEILSKPGKIKTYDNKGNYIGDQLRLIVVINRWNDIVEG
ncbi:MAG: lipoprotein insertase outer membrane protein LolB [Gammaproteobacteria bacterium]|nr:lipoprotein insertase outer membrane protein LolB [Gammaproteobacteria bacterium]